MFVVSAEHWFLALGSSPLLLEVGHSESLEHGDVR